MIWFSNNSWDFGDQDYDWETLKQHGTVTENIEEKDGFKTTTRTFVSIDGKTKITSTESSPIFSKNKKRLFEIDKEITEAVKKENYEKAAELKKEKDQLIKQLKNK